MEEIVESFAEPFKSQYRRAAERFRLPYWDYYRPRDYDADFSGVIKDGQTNFEVDFSVPQIFLLEKIMVHLPPHDSVKLENNPLRTFWFPYQGGIPEEQWRLTKLDVSLKMSYS